jgi:hypothetical protein
VPFERWTERIIAAEDERSRRELLAEIGQWRAGHLTDIPALREAAYAMSRLYAVLGDHGSATREAKSLLSLCQTPPLAMPEELAAAQAYLGSLGASGVVAGPRPKRRSERKVETRDKQVRGDQPTARTQSVTAAQEGRWADALSLLKGRKGPRMDLIRAWISLARALEQEDTALRERELRDLEVRLRAKVVGKPEVEERPQVAGRPSGEDHPLVQLLGAPVPRKWKPRLGMIERYLGEHPERIDDLAALALDHHVTVLGPREPAPWLVGIVGKALASGDAPRTRGTLDRLGKVGAYAVTAYQETPFSLLVELLRAGAERKWAAVALRRGVSSRGEPRDRKLWTLRFTEGDVERLAVVGSASESPYPEGVAERLAARIPHLCPRSVLVAPGVGNAGLREAASALGIQAVEAGEPAALLAMLDAADPVGAPQEPPRPESERPRDDALEVLRALLSREEAPPEEALAEALSSMRRVHPAFAVARAVLEEVADAERESRAVSFLRAAHSVAPERARLPEGITLAVRFAASDANVGAARELLTSEPTMARYGGPGVETVVDIARVLLEGGWSLRRVLRGPTARERRTDPFLGALADVDEGLWRVHVAREDAQAEVWFLTHLAPEGRAAAARLLASGGQRLVVLADDPGLVEWYQSLGGPEAVVGVDGIKQSLPTLGAAPT